MGIFRDFVNTGLSLIRDFAGQPATYRANGVNIPLTNVIPTNQERPAGQERRTVLESDEMEFLIARSELVRNGSEIEPEPGHTITTVIFGKILTFTVVEGRDDQCYHWSDSGETQYRVHATLKAKQ